MGLDRALVFQENGAPLICRHSAQEGGQVASPTYWPYYHPDAHIS